MENLLKHLDDQITASTTFIKELFVEINIQEDKDMKKYLLSEISKQYNSRKIYCEIKSFIENDKA